MSNPESPAVGDLVELWFSGYEEYYPGTVTALDPPNAFTVLLDDGTSWPVDRVNNIWRYAGTPAPKKSVQPPEPPQPEDDLMPDFDDDRAPLQTTDPAQTQPVVTPPPAAPEPPSQPAPAAELASPTLQPSRRKSGRAFRKSTNAPPTAAPARPVQADPVPAPVPVERRPPAEEIKPNVTRATRQRRVVQDDETSVPTTPVRAVRRGRPPLAGQKRPAADAAAGDTWDDAAEKKRKAGDGNAMANGVTPPSTGERVTRSGVRKDEESIEKLSTKAVTAIAVEAALASAKAVFKPLSDQLLSLRTELENVSESAKRAAEEIAIGPTRKRRGKAGGSPVSAVADSLQLDLSELLGGGEARIRAYANLSDKEFENFQTLIADQRKGLRELDRILVAARELGKKAEKNTARDQRASRNRSRRG